MLSLYQQLSRAGSNPSGGPPRVVLVDDHPMLRNGLAALMTADLGWEVYAQYGYLAEASEGLVKSYKDWDLLVLDLQLPDGSGFDLLRALRGMGSNCPVLVFSMLTDHAAAARIFKLGGNGFINKGCPPQDVLIAAKKVVEGGKYISPEFAEVLAGSLTSGRPVAPHEALSDREYQVLCQFAYCKSPAQIAEAIGINVNTISTFRQRILKKLGLKNTMELVRYAHEHRLIS